MCIRDRVSTQSTGSCRPSPMASKRLSRELSQIAKEGHDEEITLLVDDDSLFKWTAFIQGPPDTPYHGGTFKLSITVPQQYPHVAPKVETLTPIFHPNFHFKTGEICLDILKSDWTPGWTLNTVCRAIITLLGACEASSPLNCDAGNLVRSGDLLGFNTTARMYTQLYAMDGQQ
eukprot:TRINITY_DN23444_c0_g1_i1.p2 TRINITY_DN23444_c0_g1~~TRINITY_DN23444_c0_g1_i1.p2  ORF type:complete len:174 (+),score=54.09 TRINITY_DN23444_c0_g1_i1:159-680(+)